MCRRHGSADTLAPPWATGWHGCTLYSICIPSSTARQIPHIRNNLLLTPVHPHIKFLGFVLLPPIPPSQSYSPCLRRKCDALKEAEHAEAISAISLGSGERVSLKRYEGVTVQQHLTDQQTCSCRETRLSRVIVRLGHFSEGSDLQAIFPLFSDRGHKGREARREVCRVIPLSSRPLYAAIAGQVGVSNPPATPSQQRTMSTTQA